MLLFWKAKIVFLAMPKTASTALEAALLPHADAAILNPPGPKHTPARRWHSQLAPFFDKTGQHGLQTMALVREPRDWLGSWFRYRSRPELRGRAVSTEARSFADFVTGWLDDPQPEYARIGRQSRFVSDPSGQVIVDHLFRYEDLHRAVAFLEMRLGVSVKLPRVNLSPAGDLWLPAELEARLRCEAGAEFALWNSLSHDRADL